MRHAPNCQRGAPAVVRPQPTFRADSENEAGSFESLARTQTAIRPSESVCTGVCFAWPTRGRTGLTPQAMPLSLSPPLSFISVSKMPASFSHRPPTFFRSERVGTGWLLCCMHLEA